MTGGLLHLPLHSVPTLEAAWATLRSPAPLCDTVVLRACDAVIEKARNERRAIAFAIKKVIEERQQNRIAPSLLTGNTERHG